MAASGTHVVRQRRDPERHRAAQRHHGPGPGRGQRHRRTPILIVAGATLRSPGRLVRSGGAPSAPTRSQQARPWPASRAGYGTTVAALASANGIANPNLIVIGPLLQVPGAARPGTTGATRDRRRRGTAAARAAPHGPVGARPSPASRPATGIRSSRPHRHGTAWSTASSTPPTRLVLFDPGTLPGSGAASTPGTQTHTVAQRRDPQRHRRDVRRLGSSHRQAIGISDVEPHPRRPDPHDPGLDRVGGIRLPGARAHLLQRLGLPPQRRAPSRRHRHLRPAGHPGRGRRSSGWVDIATGSIGGHQFRLTPRRLAVVRQPPRPLRQAGLGAAPAT